MAKLFAQALLGALIVLLVYYATHHVFQGSRDWQAEQYREYVEQRYR